MTTIRNIAALSLLLTSAVVAQPAQGPSILTAKDSFTLTHVPSGTNTVEVYLEDNPDPTPNNWKVATGSAEQAAKQTWNVDARCAMRLKNLTAKQAGGKIYDFKPGVDVKNLQQEVILTTLDFTKIGQLCLDISNHTNKSGLIPQSELKKRQDQFANPATQWNADPWPVTGQILLSGRCTNPDGTSTVTNVVDKKFTAQIQVKCSV